MEEENVMDKTENASVIRVIGAMTVGCRAARYRVIMEGNVITSWVNASV
jgi:hypothetical protein